MKFSIYLVLTFGLLLFIQLVKPQLTTASMEGVALDATPPRQIEQVIKGVHSIGARDELKEWELWADEAIDYREDERWELHKVKVAFFSENEQTFRVTGDTGGVNMDTKDLVISGNVVSENTSGYVFSTEELTYSSEQRELRSSSPVEFLSDKDSDGYRFVLKGHGLFADVTNSSLEILDKVSGKRIGARGEVTDISSKRMSLVSSKRQLIFEENVEVVHGGMSIKGPTAAFVYSKPERRVVKIRVFGGVTMTDRFRSATAKVIEVNLKDESIRLTGKPRVLQNNDILFGEEIILSKGGQKLEVRNVRARVEESRDEAIED